MVGVEREAMKHSLFALVGDARGPSIDSTPTESGEDSVRSVSWYGGQAFQQAAERCGGPERPEHHSNNQESGAWRHSHNRGGSTSQGSLEYRFLRCVCHPVEERRQCEERAMVP